MHQKISFVNIADSSIVYYDLLIMITSIPVSSIRVQMGSILKKLAKTKTRFIITKSGRPSAVLLSVSDFDDILEELDPEFQNSLILADKEYQRDDSISLREYLKSKSVAY